MSLLARCGENVGCINGLVAPNHMAGLFSVLALIPVDTKLSGKSVVSLLIIAIPPVAVLLSLAT